VIAGQTSSFLDGFNEFELFSSPVANRKANLDILAEYLPFFDVPKLSLPFHLPKCSSETSLLEVNLVSSSRLMQFLIVSWAEEAQ
jgi:hypothetical protein